MRITPLLLFGGLTALMLLIAYIQAVYEGPYELLWLAIAGSFVFVLAMMLLSFIMVSRQRANTK